MYKNDSLSAILALENQRLLEPPHKHEPSCADCEISAYRKQLFIQPTSYKPLCLQCCINQLYSTLQSATSTLPDHLRDWFNIILDDADFESIIHTHFAVASFDSL